LGAIDDQCAEIAQIGIGIVETFRHIGHYYCVRTAGGSGRASAGPHANVYESLRFWYNPCSVFCVG
jgi:hypothetical protein